MNMDLLQVLRLEILLLLWLLGGLDAHLELADSLPAHHAAVAGKGTVLAVPVVGVGDAEAAGAQRTGAVGLLFEHHCPFHLELVAEDADGPEVPRHGHDLRPIDLSVLRDGWMGVCRRATRERVKIE